MQRQLRTGKGKRTDLTVLKEDEYFYSKAANSNNPLLDADTITKIGERILIKLYRGKEISCLDYFRHIHTISKYQHCHLISPWHLFTNQCSDFSTLYSELYSNAAMAWA